MEKNIYVVGAVIIRDNKILCAKRGATKSLPLKWEFPGGKIEDNETPKAALAREIKEEMNCEIKVGEKVEHTIHKYNFGIVHLTTYLCELVHGEPELTEHIEIKWLHANELKDLDWAPADIPAIEKLATGYFQK